MSTRPVEELERLQFGDVFRWSNPNHDAITVMFVAVGGDDHWTGIHLDEPGGMKLRTGWLPLTYRVDNGSHWERVE